MFKEILYSYETVTTLVLLMVSITGLYWKMKIDLLSLKKDIDKDNKELDLKIAEIQCDRKERWAKYEEKQDKQDAYQTDILRGVNELKVDVKSIKTDIDWLKKK